MGVWRNVVIDDYVPCMKGSNKLAFSGPRAESGSVELWVVLAEKAWAKVYGSFQRLEGGFTKNALTDLTGAPVENVDLEKPFAWDRILEADQKNWVICASSFGSQTKQDSVSELGLVQLHAYAVLTAKIITTEDGVEHRLVLLRNPWGNTEWTGDWSDSDPRWTPERLKEHNYEVADDGRFWMTFNDFSAHFSEVSICHSFDTYHLNCVKHPLSYIALHRVTMNQQGDLYIMTCQRDKRHYSPSYKYSNSRLIVAKEEGGNLIFEDGRSFYGERDGYIWIKNAQGSYVVYSEIVPAKEIGFSVYSENEVTIEHLKEDHVSFFLNRAYNLELAKKEAAHTELLHGVFLYSKCRTGMIPDSNDENYEGFAYDAVENTSQKKCTIQIRQEVLQNVKYLTPYEGNGYEVELEPGEHRVIVKKYMDMMQGLRMTIDVDKRLDY